MSQQCKKCESKIKPVEIKVPGNYSNFKCPVCGADVSSHRGKGALILILLVVVAWAIAFVFHHLNN